MQMTHFSRISRMGLASMALAVVVLWSCQPSSIENYDDATDWQEVAQTLQARGIPFFLPTAYEGRVGQEALALFWAMDADSALQGHFTLADGAVLTLKGGLKSDGRFRAMLYDDRHEEVAEITGTQQAQGLLQGFWQPMIAGAAPQEVWLETATTSSHLPAITTRQNAQSQSGNYSQSITLTPAHEGHYALASLQIASPNCTGELTDLPAFAYGDAWYLYGTAGCLLRIAPTATGYQVTEVACELYHGMSCSFEGMYRSTTPEM